MQNLIYSILDRIVCKKTFKKTEIPIFFKLRCKITFFDVNKITWMKGFFF